MDESQSKPVDPLGIWRPIGNPPCDSCGMRDMCYEFRMVCRAFVDYAENDTTEIVPESPSRALFDKLYRRRDRSWTRRDQAA